MDQPNEYGFGEFMLANILRMIRDQCDDPDDLIDMAGSVDDERLSLSNQIILQALHRLRDQNRLDSIAQIRAELEIEDPEAVAQDPSLARLAAQFNRLAEFYPPSHPNEPVEAQRRQVLMLPPSMAQLILAGVDCDELQNGYGEFGSVSNPIPVNGPLGEAIYLAKLRSATGRGFLWHRLGNTASDVTDHPLDLFELVAADGSEWRELFMDLYHPRRSNHAPPGLKLYPWLESRAPDKPAENGVLHKVEDFPAGLPDAMEKAKPHDAWTKRRASELRKWLKESPITRPAKEQPNSPALPENTYVLPAVDAATANRLQRERLSALFGKEGTDWKLQGFSLLHDNRTMKWSVERSTGEVASVFFDVSKVATTGKAEFGGIRTLELMISMIGEPESHSPASDK